MAYLTELELNSLGFKKIGKNVKISSKASIYNPDTISINDYSRIDDFCVVSGNVSIGKYCHITPMCLVAGGKLGIVLEDYCTLAYGVKIFSQSDDYSGETMTNSLIPSEFKKEFFAKVILKKYSIVGAGSVIFPGVELEEGTAVGSMSLVLKNTSPWGIYFGVPAIRQGERKRNILDLEKKFLAHVSNNLNGN